MCSASLLRLLKKLAKKINCSTLGSLPHVGTQYRVVQHCPGCGVPVVACLLWPWAGVGLGAMFVPTLGSKAWSITWVHRAQQCMHIFTIKRYHHMFMPLVFIWCLFHNHNPEWQTTNNNAWNTYDLVIAKTSNYICSVKRYMMLDMISSDVLLTTCRAFV